jgi:ADP-ribose pyrophosphatase YjhB (NUDIX family)
MIPPHVRDVDEHDIHSVVVAPEYCPRCGTEVGTREFDAGTYDWCDGCETVFGRVPVSAVHVVVHGTGEVLVLDEPIPQHEGLWSLPGGFAGYAEGPREAVLRELHEETGLRADPDDLTLVTVYPAQSPEMGFHFATYALDRAATAGDLRPEAEGFEAAFRPVEEVLAAGDRIRDDDQERIEMALAALGAPEA